MDLVFLTLTPILSFPRKAMIPPIHFHVGASFGTIFHLYHCLSRLLSDVSKNYFSLNVCIKILSLSFSLQLLGESSDNIVVHNEVDLT